MNCDNGELKQCGICGGVYVCSGYSVKLEDCSGVLKSLEYKVCPICYARILRSIVVVEQEGKIEGDICRGKETVSVDDQRRVPAESLDDHGEIGRRKHIAS